MGWSGLGEEAGEHCGQGAAAGAIRVFFGVEAGEAEPGQGGRGQQRPQQSLKLGQVKAARHQVVGGREVVLIEDVDVERELPIVSGYAHCRDGLMRSYDRGYTEVTFSRLAVLTGAREAIIHKEFHLCSADPKIVGLDQVRVIGRTNYDVADQLANMGMEAIHPRAAKGLRQAGIPLRVKNTFEPADDGTLILDDLGTTAPRIDIVTGLRSIFALQFFEQDMVGVKGYDSTVLEVLTRHKVRIVSKISNANTITHFVDAPLKSIRRVENDLRQSYPQAELAVRSLAIASVIGRNLTGLKVFSKSLARLEESGIDVIAAIQTTRSVDLQFVVNRQDLTYAIRALHQAVCSNKAAAPERQAA